VGIGGDPIIGTTMIDLLQLFEDDPDTDAIIMIGEIGGQMEIEAARYAKDNISKPIIGFIAGQTAPPGRRMGHAGAIVSGGDDTAEAKMRIMAENGIEVCKSPADIGKTVLKKLKNSN
jgi:succinyl-CoA synthetase alpha subunit